MMDWDFPHWIPMIIGWSILILALIIIVYIVIQSAQKTKKVNQKNIQELERSKNKLEEYNNSGDNLQKANFCHNCGYKLEEKSSKYCPRCGAKI